MRYFRIYHETAGGHVRTRWFAGRNRNAEATMACCGDLTFTEEEWEALSYTLQLNSRVRLIDETVAAIDERRGLKRGSGSKSRTAGIEDYAASGGGGDPTRPARPDEPGAPPPPGPEAA